MAQRTLNPPDARAVGSVYEFGPFRLDLSEHRLLCAGQPVALPPRVFELLGALVRREGRLATKDELMQEVWPDAFVDEANLTQSVFTLRRALGEGEGGARYIETVPRRGYRVTAPVRRVGEGDAAATAAPREEGHRPLRVRARAVTGFALAAAALAIAAYLGARQAGAGRPFEPALFTRVTRSGDVVDAAMAPDGRFIALVRGDAGRWGLWLHQVATGHTLQIGSDQDVLIDKLAFSVDGERIYFAKTTRRGEAALYVMATLGGPEQHLFDGLSSPVAVSPDGASLAFVRWNPARGERALVISRADGSEPREILTRRSPAVIVYQGPGWSPDGARVAVIVNESFGGRSAELVVVDVASRTERSVSRSLPWNSGKVVWRPDGRGLIVAAGQLWHVSYPDGRARPITREAANYGRLSLSGDGATLMALQRQETSSLWIGEGERLEPSRPVLSEGGLNHGLAWMPDGRLVYESIVDGYAKVWITDAAGRERGQLTPGPGTDYFPAVDRRGAFFVYSSVREGASTIWRRGFDGSGAKPLSAGGAQYGPDISPDGRWVAYHRADPRRSWAVWRVSADGGEPTPLVEAPSTFPVYSPDGRWIACNYRAGVSAADPWGIAILPSEGGTPVRALDVSGPPTRRLAWTADGRWLYYSNPDEAIWRVEADGSGRRPEVVRRFPGERVVALRWSPSGRRLAYVRHVERNDVVLIREK